MPDFTVVGQALHPIELCVMFDMKNSIWVEYLAIDALYCHSVLWTTQAYFDWLKGSERSHVQTQHTNATLVLLQQRLIDRQRATSDVTICVVVCLVMMTALAGDLESSRKHMAGLQKMVELRGGVRAFMENGHIQVKICRYVSTPLEATSEVPSVNEM